MTYQDALKARARIAYGFTKKAEWSPYEGAVVGTSRNDAAVAHNKKKEEDQARTAADYTAKREAVKNRALGEEASRQAAAANDYLKNQVPQNIDKAQILKMLELGSLPQELYPQAMSYVMEDKASPDNDAAIAALVQRNQDNSDQSNALLAKMYRDQFGANLQGAIGVARDQAKARADEAAYQNMLLKNRDEAEYRKYHEINDPSEAEMEQNRVAADHIGKMNDIVNRAMGEQYIRDLEQQKADAIAKRNLGYGIGAGALGGLAAGGAAYGLAGLFPSLKKRRLLRALIALGVGGAAGTGIGIGTTKGLNSGAIQGAFDKARGMIA